MRLLAALVAAVVILAASAPVGAWGFDAHKFIAERSIALMPAPLRQFFDANRAMFVERSIDPDTWRTAGFDAESPNHFLDLDWEGFGKYPFADLPRDYAAAVAKYGKERMTEMGSVPWRTEEMFGKLQRTFESYPGRPFAKNDIVFFAAWLTHYISDVHVPFHASWNYDGQRTQQWGIHARFESTMFERYRSQLRISPVAMAPIRNPREFVFDRLLEGTQMVPPILKSDLDAIGTRDVYDAAYYDTFFAANRAVLERRLNESIAATAAMIAGAWEAAGKPAVPISVTPPEQTRRRK